MASFSEYEAMTCTHVPPSNGHGDHAVAALQGSDALHARPRYTTHCQCLLVGFGITQCPDLDLVRLRGSDHCPIRRPEALLPILMQVAVPLVDAKVYTARD